MSRPLFIGRFFFLLVLLAALTFASTVQAGPQVIYHDALAAGWANWSWATINLGATTPVYGGSGNSIAVTYTGGWQGLYLAHPGVSTLGFTKLRFFAHGGSAGGQRFLVYAIRASDSGGHGPEVQVAPLVANTWTEIQIPLTDLGAANTDITGLSAGVAVGPTVPLRWNELSEPDLWGYRLTYGRVGGGTPLTVDVGPANSTWLLIPTAGQWQVTVTAYDAMGRLSSASSPVIVTTTVDALAIYLPLILK